MKNFLAATPTPTFKQGRDDWAASPRPETPAKRTQQYKADDKEEEDKEEEMIDLEVLEEEEDWQKKLKISIMEAARLTPEQAKICMQHIKQTFKERARERPRKWPDGCKGRAGAGKVQKVHPHAQCKQVGSS
jgi:hypothetical protein